MGTGTAASPEVRILLARHPETLANRQRRYIGVTDSPYTPRGARQARALARCVAGFRAGAVFASPARRASEPAVEAARVLGVRVELCDDLREVGWGEAEGLTYAEIRRAGIPMDYAGGPTAGEVARGGETWTSFAARVDRAAADAAAAGVREGGRVAVITHGGVVRALLVRWLGLPADAAWRFAIPPASVALLRLHEDVGTLEAFGLSPSAFARGAARR